MPALTGLFKFFTFTRGISVWITDGVVYEARYPWQGDLLEADTVCLGGHDTEISDDDAAILTAAGYGEYIL